jgi:hypothetical protein
VFAAMTQERADAVMTSDQNEHYGHRRLSRPCQPL